MFLGHVGALVCAFVLWSIVMSSRLVMGTLRFVSRELFWSVDFSLTWSLRRSCVEFCGHVGPSVCGLELCFGL